MSTKRKTLKMLSSAWALRFLHYPEHFDSSKQELKLSTKDKIEALIQVLPDEDVPPSLLSHWTSSRSIPSLAEYRASWMVAAFNAKKNNLAAFFFLGVFNDSITRTSMLVHMKTYLKKMDTADRHNTPLSVAVKRVAVSLLPRYVASIQGEAEMDGRTRNKSNLTVDLVYLLSAIYYTGTFEDVLSRIPKQVWVDAKNVILDGEVELSKALVRDIEPWLRSSSRLIELSDLPMSPPTPAPPKTPKM